MFKKVYNCLVINQYFQPFLNFTEVSSDAVIRHKEIIKKLQQLKFSVDNKDMVIFVFH